MAKFNEKLQGKIAELIEAEFFSISQVCKALGISRQIFYRWMNDKPAFRESVEQALECRNEELLSQAYMSIKKQLADGVSVTEKDTYIPDKSDETRLVFKSRTVTTKEYIPDLRTVKILLDGNSKRILRSTSNKD